MNDFWKLAERVGDPRMLKIATLLTSEFLHWKGRFAEVVRRYEDVVEDLEEFGDDEATLKAGARVGLCYVRCGRIARGHGYDRRRYARRQISSTFSKWLISPT